MFLPLLTLIWALFLSSVAAYFSIAGLAALFAAAFWPVVVMGIAIEGGKLIAATIVHHYWESSLYTQKHRIYLLSAVAAGMLVTGLGVYGYLSKGHLEQEAPVAGIELQLERGEQRITVLKGEVQRYEARQKQLDSVIETLIAGQNIRGKSGATLTRQSQEIERKEIQQGIEASYAEISKVQDELMPLRHQNVEVTAKLGPVKYVAELFGWKETGTAVRFVIFILMWCFDPLAIVLLISGEIGIKEALRLRKIEKEEREERAIAEAAIAKEREIKLAEKEKKRAAEEKRRDAVARRQELVEQRKITELEINNRFKKESEDLRVQLNALRDASGDVTELVEENVHLKDETNRLRHEIDLLVRELENNQEELARPHSDNITPEANEEMEQAIQRLADEISRKNDEMLILVGEAEAKSALEAKVVACDEEISSLNAIISTLTDELERQSGVLSRELASRESAFLDTIEDAQARTARAEAAYEDLMSGDTEAREAVAAHLQTLMDAVEAIQAGRDMESRIAVLTEELEIKKDIEESLNLLREDLTAKEASISDMTSAISALHAVVGDKELAIQSLAADLDAARAIVTPEELAILQATLDEKEKTLDAFKLEIETRNRELVERNRELEIICEELEKKAATALRADDDLRDAINSNDRDRVIEILERRPEILEDMITIITNYQRETQEGRMMPDVPDTDVPSLLSLEIDLSKSKTVSASVEAQSRPWLDFPAKR